MTEVLAFLQNLTTVAFVLLGVAVGIAWARHRDRSQGFLALAIVLLSLVSLLGRIPTHIAPTLLTTDIPKSLWDIGFSVCGPGWLGGPNR